ncbi:MAG: hypothetical protein VYE22_20810 [Myxococcota bacterium]|nr:hypothetical protein [Myxococcota bacterium]
MSTPIKPPGGSPDGIPEPADTPEGSQVEGGELRGMVERAGADRAEGSAGSEAASPLDAVRADVEAGRIDADQAIERLVQRALAGASGLSPSQRDALEAQLRDALTEDPTLVALRKDLERASSAKP